MLHFPDWMVAIFVILPIINLIYRAFKKRND